MSSYKIPGYFHPTCDDSDMIKSSKSRKILNRENWKDKVVEVDINFKWEGSSFSNSLSLSSKLSTLSTPSKKKHAKDYEERWNDSPGK